MKLYIYDHCPYCTKARMIFGIKQIKAEIITLLNDDEDTPISMIGQKMVPILEEDDGNCMPESMDIVHHVDTAHSLASIQSIPSENGKHIAQWLNDIREVLYALTMPRWALAPLEEFATQSAIDYFTRKKEAYIGPFAENMDKSPALVARANELFETLEAYILAPDAVHGALSDDDFHLFAVIRSLSIVKGLVYPPKLEAYRQTMSKLSGVPLHDDIAI